MTKREQLVEAAFGLLCDQREHLDVRKMAFNFLQMATGTPDNPEAAYAPPEMPESLRGDFPSSTALDHPLTGAGSNFFAPMGIFGTAPTMEAAIALDGADATIATNQPEEV